MDRARGSYEPERLSSSEGPPLIFAGLTIEEILEPDPNFHWTGDDWTTVLRDAIQEDYSARRPPSVTLFMKLAKKLNIPLGHGKRVVCICCQGIVDMVCHIMSEDACSSFLTERTDSAFDISSALVHAADDPEFSVEWLTDGTMEKLDNQGMGKMYRIEAKTSEVPWDTMVQEATSQLMKGRKGTTVRTRASQTPEYDGLQRLKATSHSKRATSRRVDTKPRSSNAERRQILRQSCSNDPMRQRIKTARQVGGSDGQQLQIPSYSDKVVYLNPADEWRAKEDEGERAGYWIFLNWMKQRAESCQLEQRPHDIEAYREIRKKHGGSFDKRVDFHYRIWVTLAVEKGVLGKEEADFWLEQFLNEDG